MKQPTSLLPPEKLPRPTLGFQPSTASLSPWNLRLWCPCTLREASAPACLCGTGTEPLLALGYLSKSKVSLRAAPRPGLNFLQA